MRYMIRQCIRGTRDLPGVGSNPGTMWVIVWPLGGALAGIEHGFMGAVWGVLVFLALFGPLYLYGAYERAELSDRITRRQRLTGQQ